MSKRYVFWRGPDAKPHKGNDARHAPVEILAAWGRATEINQEGKPSWQGFGWMRLEVALKMALAVIGPDGTELDESDAWEIAQKALRAEAAALGGKKPIDPKRFAQRADALAAAFFRLPIKPYVLVTSLSVKSVPAKSVSLGGCKITFLSSRRRYRPPQILKGLPPQSLHRAHLDRTNYQWLAIATNGRSWAEAVRRGLDALTLLRALWTTAATYGRSTLSWGNGTPQPLSVVHAGPIHTLHTPDGTPVAESFYWRDNDPQEDRSLFFPQGGWADLEKIRRRVMQCISRLPYRSDMEQLLIRYVTALDHTDHDIAFLQMWTILEKITDTIGGKYDDTIKRATWFFKERAQGKQLLECIRIQRNRYVHAAQSADEPDQAAYLVKSLIEPHLLSLIFNEYSVSSLSDYAETFSLPVDVALLEKMQKRVAMALRVHRVKPRPVASSSTSP